MSLTRILLLEDDFVLSEILCEFLEEQGFEVTLCEDASNALELAYQKNFDLWLLDVKVPLGQDFANLCEESERLENPGFSLLELLRQARKDTPCIFITSLSSMQDLQKGYNVGCDDFLKKPFELLELNLRIQTLLKRTFSHKKEEFEDLGNGLRFEFISKNLYKQDTIIPLTQKEGKLLVLLLQNANHYVSNERIFEELWDLGQEPSEQSLRAYIKNLRKLIGKEKILTQYNKGYCYVS